MVRVQLLLVASSSIALGSEEVSAMTCGDVKDFYKQESCCGQPEKALSYFIVPGPGISLNGTNRCEGSKPAWDNLNCTKDSLIEALEQAGADVSDTSWGTFASSVSLNPNMTNHGMIQTAYYKAGLCPVNVHWHIGAEHRSAGQYDESGTGPGHAGTPSAALPVANPPPVRRLAESHTRYGYACKHYDGGDAKFTTEYNWQHCLDMHVGETYEVHWPHSTLGACGTPDQYQTPFYDGVFCGAPGDALNGASGNTTSGNVGVQAQVFTIVNDEHYYYPDLMRGMIVDGSHGDDIAIYTGSTTGTSRNNEVCSAFAPITWQVDRTCHLISASSFDKMCSEMKQQRDDMSGDLHPHGARELVWQNMSADNMMDHTYAIPR